jgi:hypothetical protein
MGNNQEYIIMKSRKALQRRVLTLLWLSILLPYGTSPSVSSSLASEESSMFQDLQSLRRAIAQSDNPMQAKAHIGLLAQSIGIEFQEQIPYNEKRYCFSFTRPIPAGEFCRAMGWSRPYAISTDVHQNSWSIHLRTADLDDRMGRPRIATDLPRLGKWAVRSFLKNRPAGKLPNLTSGASPAYDLWEFDAEVIGVEVEEPGSGAHRF